LELISAIAVAVGSIPDQAITINGDERSCFFLPAYFPRVGRILFTTTTPLFVEWVISFSLKEWILDYWS
jgi:hypothetical protein